MSRSDVTDYGSRNTTSPGFDSLTTTFVLIFSIDDESHNSTVAGRRESTGRLGWVSASGMEDCICFFVGDQDVV